jgi:glutaredoxin
MIASSALAAALGSASGCSRHTDDGTEPGITKELPSLAIRDETPNLMLTWVDEHGDTHVELHPGDVPDEGRSLVRVVVSDREDGTRDQFYVTDLTQQKTGGEYACRTMPRRGWEDLIEKRRQAYLAKVAPPAPQPSGAPPGAPTPNADKAPTAASSLTVVIYGAAWCKPCHEAADYLKRKGVQVIVKDVDTTPEAQDEMRDKLTRAGIRGGSIPIIDVRGQILIGFSPSALDRAVAKALGGTAL